jgi:hypothetical protein
MFKLSPRARTARLTALKDDIQSGSGDRVVRFYSLPLPANPSESISTQVLAAVCTLSDPVGSIANNKLTFVAISNDLAVNATTTIAFGRVFDGDGIAVGDGDAGSATSTAMFRFNRLAVIEGGTVKLLSIEIIEGNG